MKEHVPAALGTYLCPRVSPRETTWFLECGFILHPMANAVIRAVSSVKGLKQEQRRLFLGTLGKCWAPYQVLAPLGVLTFHVQNAKGGSLPRGRRRAKWWKNRAWVWQEFLESHVLPVWFLFVCLFLFLSPEWIKVAGRLHRRPPWNHLQAASIWTHRGSGGQWGPFSGGASASPPERWVSFRAGHQKGFVSGKGLWTSGGWSGRHPFKVGEPRRSATWLWGYGLPLFRIVGRGRQDTGNRVCFPSLLSRLEVDFSSPPRSKHSNVFTFLGLWLNHWATLLCLSEHSESLSSTELFTLMAADTYSSSSVKFCLLQLTLPQK